MKLTNFLNKHRSESKKIFILRWVAMFAILACLTIYTTIIIIDVIQDAPIIRTSLKHVDAIRVPDIVFNCPYKFVLICTEIYYKINETNPKGEDCPPGDLIQPDEKRGPTSLYWGAYQSSKAFTYKEISDNDNYLLLMVALTVQVMDINYKPDNNIPIPISIAMWALDPDYDTYTNYIKEKRFDELLYSIAIPKADSNSPYESLVESSEYVLSLSQAYQFQYSRRINEIIKKSWINDVGFPPDYETRSHIESTSVPGPLNPLSNAANSSMLFIRRPLNNVVQVDREIRSNTYLGGFGLVGGAWTLATTLYAFLFGTDTLDPWGFLQLHCCCGISRATRNKFKDTFKKIPFLDTDTTPSIDTLSLAEQNKLLLAKINSLELFLQEYVVDVSFLGKIREEIRTSNAVPNSPRNSTAGTTGTNSMSSTNSNTVLNLTQNSTISN